MVIKPGELIAGKYRVVRELGKGAMGIVVAAEHVDLGALRAIKLMRGTYGFEEGAEDRFMREARATVNLKSKHAVQVIDVGRLDSGDPYIVMEYLEGTDLSTLLKQRRVLPAEEAVSYMLQVCEALAEAHAMGIVHRDLKPANLFLSTGAGGAPVVKVLDFGIAKVMEHVQGGGELQMTCTGMIMGSPYYMSPEQMRSSKDVDAQSDIWSLGVILYRLVTGRLPFDVDRLEPLKQAVETTVPAPPSSLNPEVPAGLERVIQRCLEKDPRRRFQSVGDLAQALASFGPEEIRWSLPGLFRTPSMAEIDAATQRIGPSSTQTVGPSSTQTVRPAVARPAGAPAIQWLPGEEQKHLDAPAGPTPTGQTNASWGQRTGRQDTQRTKRFFRLGGLAGAVVVGVMATLIVSWIRRAPEPSAGPSAEVSVETAAAPSEPGAGAATVVSPSPPDAPPVEPSEPTESTTAQPIERGAPARPAKETSPPRSTVPAVPAGVVARAEPPAETSAGSAAAQSSAPSDAVKPADEEPYEREERPVGENAAPPRPVQQPPATVATAAEIGTGSPAPPAAAVKPVATRMNTRN